MTSAELKEAVDGLITQAKDVCETAKAAARNRKSLTGDNFYGNKFHTRAVSLASTEARLTRALSEDSVAAGYRSRIIENLATIRSVQSSPRQRNDSFKDLREV